MQFLSVSLAAFGLGSALIFPATPAAEQTPKPVDYQQCGIFDIEEDPAYPFGAQLLEDLWVDSPDGKLRVATFDVNLSAKQQGQLGADLAGGASTEAAQVAKAIQQADADVVLLTGIDADEAAARSLNNQYLKHAQDGGRAVDYPYVYAGPTNKGTPSGADLDNDQVVGGPADAWGYGEFPGQGAMVLLSKHPIDAQHVQTVTKQRWSQMPGNTMPQSGLNGTIAEAMPVMESGLWDVPIKVGGSTVRVIAVQTDQVREELTHSAPRHSDQLRIVGDWLSAADYLQDDRGAAPGNHQPYVVLGELGRNHGNNQAVDDMLENLGVAEQGIHDDTNYILPADTLEIARHGSIRDQEMTPSNPGTEQPNLSGTPELLWSDLTY